MFEEKNPAPSAGTEVPAKAAEDMFDKSEGTTPTPPPRPAIFAPKEPEQAGGFAIEGETDSGGKKKYLVLGGLLLGVAVIAAGGWYGYKNFSGFSGKEQANPAVEQQPEAVAPTPVAPTGGDAVDSAAGEGKVPTGEVSGAGQAANDPSVTSSVPKDSDDDSLTDEEEAKLGTNPNSVDSDNDGLFDYEEVKVYGTDPLKADTDGDGYNDGQEVKGGFNPLGWGKLFDNKPAKK
jgi:hypothetical protein